RLPPKDHLVQFVFQFVDVTHFQYSKIKKVKRRY
ncbi:MAG: hypothetical protein ACI87E_005085, partial [Mariniblastus sp.]